MSNAWAESLKLLPKTLAEDLKALSDTVFSGHLTHAQLQQLAQGSRLDPEALLFALLPVAASFARAPVSGFHVGVIVQAGSGDIYMGANLELPGQALLHTVHAEQSALSYAWHSGETALRSMIGKTLPCGYCRQFMHELHNGAQLKIHLPGKKVQTLADYLPDAFSPSELGISHALLEPHAQALVCDSDDALVLAAVEQANLSYAPYSHNYSAVALEMQQGDIYCGRYAENVAFNPSLLPMQVALSCLARQDIAYSEIKRAVLVESAEAKISLESMSALALASISQVALQSIAIR